MTQEKLSYNLEEIKKQAAQFIEEGTITQDYPLNLNEAYTLLNAALATEIMRTALSTSSNNCNRN
ncbi:MAG TPA: hypothetical protein PKD00_05360 [Burkholderiales bacterium]|nr:hypothetical protein [Burkholderiales bacterium]